MQWKDNNVDRGEEGVEDVLFEDVLFERHSGGYDLKSDFRTE